MGTFHTLLKNKWMHFSLVVMLVLGLIAVGLGFVVSCSYHPPFVPIVFTIDSSGNISAKADSPTIATPAGDFDISIDPTSNVQIPNNGFLMTIEHLLNGQPKNADFKIHEDANYKLINIDNGEFKFCTLGPVSNVDARGHHTILVTSVNDLHECPNFDVDPSPTPTQNPPTPTEIPSTPTSISAPAQNIIYEAAIPGPGCTSDDGLWASRGDGPTICMDNGMELDASGTEYDEAAFDPQQLPGIGSLTTYCVKTTAEFLTNSAGAAIIIGIHGQAPGGQVIQFFQDGELVILRFRHIDDHTAAPDTGPPLAKTTFSATSPYHLAIGVDGSGITVWVNQKLVAIATDSTYTTTKYVLIGLKADTSVSQGQTDKASFSDFEFEAGSLADCGS